MSPRPWSTLRLCLSLTIAVTLFVASCAPGTGSPDTDLGANPRDAATPDAAANASW